MALRRRLTALARAGRLPRRTVRLRLAILYGSLFFVSGAALLAITYVLARRDIGGPVVFQAPHIRGALVGVGAGHVRVHFSATQVGALNLTPKQMAAQARLLETQSAQLQNSELHSLLVGSVIALCVMTLLSIVLGWIVAGRVLRPLRTISATAKEISAANLHERLGLDGPDDELKELGDTFDALLARLEASFQAQRQFVANASHELRTPLARQRTLSQVALADPAASVSSLKAAHSRVLVSGAELERLIDGLLTLSRGQAGVDRREPMDLAEVVEQVLVGARADADQRRVELAATASSAPVAGDQRLVERLMVNVVGNAICHNEEGGYVEIWTGVVGGRAVLRVANTGPVVPADQLDRLLQPFQRLEGTRLGRGEGFGLGLSIARAVAEAHGATLRLRSRAEGGLLVEVAFPMAPIDHRSTAEDPAASRPSLLSSAAPN